MAKNHQRNTSSATPAGEVKPVLTQAAETVAAAESLSMTATECASRLISGTGASLPAVMVNIEVQHTWRRAATKAGLEKLWNAMELGRPGSLGCPGDEVLDQQREAWAAFAKVLLGDDAPFMEFAT